MKLFRCSACDQIVHFENSACTHCGHALAYLPERGVVAALDAAEGYWPCGNQLDHGACNWAVLESDGNRFCRACRLNDVIPNLSEPVAKQAWIRLEENKRRMLYGLLELGLPVESRAQRPGGLAFAFKQDVPGGEQVMIGHDVGLITINVAEADSPFREKTRLELGESYRTLLGHFRHEIGHYYWSRLIAHSPRLDRFRELYGDERASYEDALARHYQTGASRDWPARFVSSYASTHPWEDWAESWAHYLHMVDTLETARSFGVALRPPVANPRDEMAIKTRRLDFDDIDELFRAWVPLTIALNALSRSMGQPDPYPFVVPQPALDKIRFVHEVIAEARRAV